MLFPQVQSLLYRQLIKPILFKFDPEFDHNLMTGLGELFENQDWLIGGLFRYRHPSLTKKVLDITFDNPIGLAAGFDYDGHLAKVMNSIGFGFNTVGTVTALPYGGNSFPRLTRLPKSKSILVNKGFKSDGAVNIAKRLDAKNLKPKTIGISVGSSNVPQINTLDKAIDDYLFTFKLFKDKSYVKYFELNISCPNIVLKGTFTNSKNFSKLCQKVSNLKLPQPIFVKMPNEISFSDSDTLVSIGIKHGFKGYIFSNLVKDRTNPALDKQEIQKVSHLSGNFSGRPAYDNSNKLISHTRIKFGSQVAIIGCGGIFSSSDAIQKLKSGSDLVQLISGMIYEGPQLIGQINQSLSQNPIKSEV